MRRRDISVILVAMMGLVSGCTAAAGQGQMQWIRVAPDGRGFVKEGSDAKFTAWGFNYDHDEKDRLLEEYWETEWPKVEQDFHEMRQLGANVVRIHLQFGKFMDSPTQANPAALDRLGKLLRLAEKEGLYLDITGLACYFKEYVPAWYDAMDEAQRWAAQAAFWEAVATRCAGSPAVFCYDLMNEPVVPGGEGKGQSWLGPPLGRSYFVQFITLEAKGRPRPAIAAAWIKTLTAAIRKHAPRHLITVGLVDWSLDRPGLTSGFVPKEIAGDLDFLCVHLYPERGKLAEAIRTLEGFVAGSGGKPVVIEETYLLSCGPVEMSDFIDRSRPLASGWIGFYWGKTPAELQKSNTLGDKLMLQWLEVFARKAGQGAAAK